MVITYLKDALCIERVFVHLQLHGQIQTDMYREYYRYRRIKRAGDKDNIIDTDV